MKPEFIDFTIKTISESFNVDVEIKNDKVIFPEGTSEYTKNQVNNFWEAILADQASKVKN